MSYLKWLVAHSKIKDTFGYAILCLIYDTIVFAFEEYYILVISIIIHSYFIINLFNNISGFHTDILIIGTIIFSFILSLLSLLLFYLLLGFIDSYQLYLREEVKKG